MIGYDEERAKRIKGLPRKAALDMVWMWMKDGVITTRAEFAKAMDDVECTACTRHNANQPDEFDVIFVDTMAR